MNSSDNVFLLTLIDFLLQIIFGSIFVYALQVATSPNSEVRESAIRRLLAHFGISDIVTLTDQLTRLVPAEAITNDKLFKTPGETKRLVELEKFEGEHGKLFDIPEKLVKLRKFEEGIGRPPCVYTFDPDGKKIPQSVATLVGTETTITLKGNPNELKEVLDLLGLSFRAVEMLSLQQFRDRFAPLRSIKPDCLYYITFIETTRFVEPRDAVSSAFGFSTIRRQRRPGN